MAPELERAVATADNIVERWFRPEPDPEHPGGIYIVDWPAKALLALGARCGALEAVAPGPHQIKLTIGCRSREQIEKIYKYDYAGSLLRSMLARFAVLTDELANPALISMHFEATLEGAARKCKYYKNNLYGFEMAFDFINETGTTPLTVVTRNGGGVETHGLDGYGFRITVG